MVEGVFRLHMVDNKDVDFINSVLNTGTEV